ncbi:MAG TPA: hypothetical protein PKE64_30055 [Anaerolineae bacterium]|nr:hypothetical protein [Anaerolineae bacterium]
MPVIANTTIISNFASLNRLTLLKNLFGSIYIPEQVFEETQSGLLQGYDFYKDLTALIFPFSGDGWLHLTALKSTAEFKSFGELLVTLHAGEAACIAIAQHLNWTFLSDDKAARKLAAQLNVPVSGTLGVLLTLCKKNLLSMAEADHVLKQMVKLGYHSPISSVSELLKDK